MSGPAQTSLHEPKSDTCDISPIHNDCRKEEPGGVLLKVYVLAAAQTDGHMSRATRTAGVIELPFVAFALDFFNYSILGLVWNGSPRFPCAGVPQDQLAGGSRGMGAGESRSSASRAPASTQMGRGHLLPWASSSNVRSATSGASWLVGTLVSERRTHGICSPCRRPRTTSCSSLGGPRGRSLPASSGAIRGCGGPLCGARLDRVHCSCVDSSVMPYSPTTEPSGTLKTRATARRRSPAQPRASDP